MNDDLAAYLGPIDRRLLTYLDENHDLLVPAIENLYRYAVALLQGLIRPEDVIEDWEDFFYLAGAFVFAQGSERLRMSARLTTVIWVDRTPGPLNQRDRMLLVDLVRELGEVILARRRTLGGTATR